MIHGLFCCTIMTLRSQTPVDSLGTPLVNWQDIALTNTARQLSLYPKEKLYLHLDRSAYLPGDTVRLKAYRIHSTFHTPLDLSRYVYVELINLSDSLIGRVKLRCDSLGQVNGYLPIPKQSPVGLYGLRAYTRYMLQEGEDYLFCRSLCIAPQQPPLPGGTEKGDVAPEDYDVRFYPEGGNLVAGSKCRVAYKAQDKNGNAIAVRLSLTDGEGHPLLADSTLYEGLGCFSFTPVAGRKYKAVATTTGNSDKSFKLPIAREEACALQVSLETDRRLHVTVLTGRGMTADGLLLVLSVRGMPFYAAPVRDENVVVHLKDVPTGIIQCLLLDHDCRKLSERLCFSVSATDSLADVAGVADVASVADVAGDSLDLFSSLFLASELPGYILNPSSYFDVHNPAAVGALDFLLMTHEWRRYNLPKVLRGDMELPAGQPETGFSLSGTLKGKGLLGRPRQGEVILVDADHRFRRTVLSDSVGNFRFDGFEFPDGTGITLRARSVEDPKKKLVVEVAPEEFAKSPLGIPRKMVRGGVPSTSFSSDVKQTETYVNGMLNVSLGGITVKPTLWGGTDYRKMGQRQIVSSQAKTLPKIMKEFGIRVSSGNRLYLTYKKTWVELFVNGTLYDTDVLYYISPEDVESIQFVGDINPLYPSLWMPIRMFYYSSGPRLWWIWKDVAIIDITLKPTFDPRNIVEFQGYGSYGFALHTSQTDGITVYPLGYQPALLPR